MTNKSITLGMVLAAIGTFLSAATGVLLARLMGPSDYGAYAAAFAGAMIISALTQVGIPRQAIHKLATYRASGFKRKVSQYLSYCGMAPATVGLLLLLCVHAFGPTESLRTLLLTFWVGISFAYLAVFAGVLRGMGHPLLAQVFEAAVRPGLSILLVMGVYTVSVDKLSPSMVLAIVASAASVAVAALIYSINSRGYRIFGSKLSAQSFWGWLRGAGPFLTITLLTIASDHLSVLAVSVIEGSSATGFYKVGALAGGMIALVPQTLVNMSLASMAGLYSSGALKSLQCLIMRLSSVAVMLTLPLIIVIALAGEPLLVFAFGQEYAAALKVMLIVVAGRFVQIIIGPSGQVLMMCGFSGFVSKVWSISSVVSISLGSFLTYKYSYAAMAVMVVIGDILAAGFFAYYLKRFLNIQSFSNPIDLLISLNRELRRIMVGKQKK